MKLVLGAALLAALLAMAVPAPARAQDGTVHAVDTAFQAAGDPGSSSVTVPVGGVVAFDYDDGSQQHNVAFDTLQPASCDLTEGDMNGGSVPPLPADPSAARWAGTCTFTAAGTYAFHCQLHGSMTGAVHVGAAPAPTAPAPPANVTATPGDGSATVSFTPGAANGAPITAYTVTASPGGAQVTGTGSPITVGGLANGTAYTFRVTATNAAGTSVPSAPSAPVTPSRSAGSGGGSGPGSGTPGGPGGGPAGGGGTPANAFTVTRVRARANGVIRLAATLPGPGRLAAVARDARRSRRFARTQLDVAAAGTVTVRLRPGAAGRRLLRRSGRPPKLVLTIRYTPAGGTTRTLTRRGVRIPRG